MRVLLRTLRARVVDRRVALVTNWQPVARTLSGKAFADLCALTATSADFMIQLPATLRCQIFNQRLRAHRKATTEIEVLLSEDCEATGLSITFYRPSKGDCVP